MEDLASQRIVETAGLPDYTFLYMPSNSAGLFSEISCQAPTGTLRTGVKATARGNADGRSTSKNTPVDAATVAAKLTRNSSTKDTADNSAGSLINLTTTLSVCKASP